MNAVFQYVASVADPFPSEADLKLKLSKASSHLKTTLDALNLLPPEVKKKIFESADGLSSSLNSFLYFNNIAVATASSGGEPWRSHAAKAAERQKKCVNELLAIQTELKGTPGR